MQLNEFLTLAEGTLGHRLDEPTYRSFRIAHREFTRKQAQLVKILDSGMVTPEQYLDNFNSLYKALMDRMRDALGEEQFTIVFGEAGRHPESLIDRSIFMDAISIERTSTQ